VLSDRKVAIHSRSLGSAIWENPINLLKFLAVVGTWPLTSISYGPVRLCAAISQNPGIVKFAGHFWDIISLNSLRFVEIPSSSPAPIEKLEETHQETRHEPLEALALETPKPSPPDRDDLYADPAAESAINASVNELCISGDDTSLPRVLENEKFRVNEYEVFKALEEKNPDLAAKIESWLDHDEYHGHQIRAIKKILTGNKTEGLNALAIAPKMDMIHAYNYLQRCHPEIIRAVHSGASEILRRHRKLDKLKALDLAAQIPHATPGAVAQKCFGEDGKLDRDALYVLARGPSPYVAKVWKELSERGVTFAEIHEISFREILYFSPLGDLIRRILEGMPPEELANTLQGLDDSGICDSLKYYEDSHLTAKVLVALPVDRATRIIANPEMDFNFFVGAHEGLEESDPEKMARWFPKTADEIRKLPREDGRMPICLLNMESPLEAAKLTYEIYGDEFFKKFSFTFRSHSFQPFIKFAKIFNELIKLAEIKHSAINDELFIESGESRVLNSGVARNLPVLRALIGRGKILPGTFAKFLGNKPFEVQGKYLAECHQEFAAQVRAILQTGTD
jgi:hypothetical protein